MEFILHCSRSRKFNNITKIIEQCKIIFAFMHHMSYFREDNYLNKINISILITKYDLIHEFFTLFYSCIIFLLLHIFWE